MNIKLSLRPLRPAFTLIELMIVIAIIAILATIAIPSYTTYTQKAALSELLRASAGYKSDVEICIYNTNKVADCSEGTNSVQQGKTSSTDTKYLKSIGVSGGVISVEGKGTLEGYSYKMTPKFANNMISWSTTCSGDDKSLFPAGFCSTAPASP